jgi:hypothetical protein
LEFRDAQNETQCVFIYDQTQRLKSLKEKYRKKLDFTLGEMEPQLRYFSEHSSNSFCTQAELGAFKIINSVFSDNKEEENPIVIAVSFL